MISDHTKCIRLSNQLCMNRPTLNDNPEIYTQGLRYYPLRLI